MKLSFFISFFVSTIISTSKGNVTDDSFAHLPEINGAITSIEDLPVSDAIKKYCKGNNVNIKFNNENFVCEIYDSVETSGCVPYYDNLRTFTSFNNDCFDGRELENGIYQADYIKRDAECQSELNNMLEYTFGFTKRDNIEVARTIGSIDELPISEKAKFYCNSDFEEAIIQFNEKDFICGVPSIYKPRPTCGSFIYVDYFYTSLNDECFDGSEIEEGIYQVLESKYEECTLPEDMELYLFDPKLNKITTTKTLPVSTKTIPTTTKSIPTTTKSIPTTTKSIPTTTKSIPTTTKSISTTTKSIPTTTKSIPTTTKSIPTTTKSIPTSTKTIPNTCNPTYITITEKETIITKEIITVTVTEKSQPTSDVHCASKWAQCGGIGYNGPTCCQSGSSCHQINEYYSQCY